MIPLDLTKRFCKSLSLNAFNTNGRRNRNRKLTFPIHINSDVNSDLHAGLPFTPSAYDFDNFTFDDPFSTTTSYPPLPGHSHSHSQGHSHNHGLGSHTAYNLPSVRGPIVGPVAAEAEAALKNTISGGGINEAGSPSDLLDNKLLGFSPPIPSGQATLIDSETGRFADLNMTAELYGMFFVAEDVFSGNTPDQGQSGQSQAQHPGARPLELTCYRRNLWQCTGQITLPRHAVQCSLLLANDDNGGGNGGGNTSGGEGGKQAQVKELWASITAVESIEGKQTEIISIPWKSTSNPAVQGQQQQQQQQEEPSKTATTPPKQLLDLSAGQEVDGSGNRVLIPVSWKRLQFKHATANNGRRKGLQQHYVVQINLLAKTTESGEKLIKLAEIQSGPVIVRGRSPRNFDSRRDVPLTGDRKGMGMLQRTNTEGSVGGGVGAGFGSENGKQRMQQQPQNMDRSDMLQRWNSLGNQVCFYCPSIFFALFPTLKSILAFDPSTPFLSSATNSAKLVHRLVLNSNPPTLQHFTQPPTPTSTASQQKTRHVRIHVLLRLSKPGIRIWVSTTNTIMDILILGRQQ